MIGYYVPFMIIGSILLVVGTALIHVNLNVSTPSASWIGYQVLVGAGAGFASQQSLIAVQTVLPPADIPIATALVIFFQTLGGAVSLLYRRLFSTPL